MLFMFCFQSRTDAFSVNIFRFENYCRNNTDSYNLNKEISIKLFSFIAILYFK